MNVRIPYHHRNSGNGLGGILKSLSGIIRPLYSSAKQILKPVGKELGREGISFLASTGNDVLKGKRSLKDSLKKNYKKSKKSIKKKAVNAFQGRGKKNRRKKGKKEQRVSGKRRRRRIRRRRVVKEEKKVEKRRKKYKKRKKNPLLSSTPTLPNYGVARVHKPSGWNFTLRTLYIE